MVDIRELTIGEADELAHLLETVDPDFTATNSRNAESQLAFLAEPLAFVLGAYVDVQPVGFAWGLQMRSPTGRLTTYLHHLMVHEDSRRQGIGEQLTSAAMDLGRRQNSTRFWLSTGGHNDGAQALYDSLGGDRKPLGDVNYWWQLDQ